MLPSQSLLSSTVFRLAVLGSFSRLRFSPLSLMKNCKMSNNATSSRTCQCCIRCCRRDGGQVLRALATPAVDCRGRQAPQQQEVRLSQLARHRQALSHTDTDTDRHGQRHRQTRTQTSLHEAQKRCERCRASANHACVFNRNQVSNTSRQKFLAGDLMMFSL